MNIDTTKAKNNKLNMKVTAIQPLHKHSVSKQDECRQIYVN
jgi:hypothetical protein